MSDIQKQNKTCSHTGCNHEVYENEKCIFHCEKDDWFIENSGGGKEWKKNKVKLFWEKVREYIWKTPNLKEYDFSNFIFPEFEEVSEEDTEEFKVEGKKYYCLKPSINKNFWKGMSMTFTKILDFNNAIFLGKVNFNYTVFEKESWFAHNLIFQDYVEFIESTFQEKTTFESVNFEGDVYFGGSIFEDEVKFYNINVKKQIWFYETSFLSHTSFVNSKNDRVINKLIFERAEFGEKADIFFDKLDINYLSFKKNVNYSEYISFFDINILNELKFNNTNISNMEFHNCNLKNSKINIQNVSFISNNGHTIFNGVNWGNIRETFDKKTNRDTFRQLKYVNEKQGNIIEANKFYSAEMDAYRQEMKADKKELKANIKKLKDNKEKKKKQIRTLKQDMLIFCLNEKVSNFSQNWLRPLGWFFLLGFIAFVLSNIVKIISYFNNTSKINLTSIWNASNQYFEYLNPFNTSAGEWNPIIWLIFKALSVFIIYQFIISLRRQTRR